MNNLVEAEADRLKKKIEEEMGKPEPDRSAVMECLQELRRLDADEAADHVLKAWEAAQQTKSRPAARAWRRAAVAAAALLVLVICVAVPCVVNAEYLCGRFAQWTDTVFKFFNPADEQEDYVYTTDHPGLQQLYDAVANLGVTQSVVPMWIPDEYELTDLTINEQSAKAQVYAQFDSLGNKLIYRIDIHKEYTTYTYSKDSDGIEIYENSGIVHYLVSNNDTVTVAWTIENIECSISADGQENMMYRILDSIYEMEGD